MTKLLFLFLLLVSFSRPATLDVCLVGCTYNLSNADDGNPIQMAMNAAACGDVVSILAGETHPVSIAVPKKSCASNPIRVTTSRRIQLPYGRVNPTDHASLMPILEPLFSSNPLISMGQAQQTISSVNTSTDTVTFTGPHGMSDNDPVSCRSGTISTPGLPTGLTQNAVYYVSASTSTTMKYSLTPGGAAIDLSGSLTGTNYCTNARPTSGWIFEGLRLITKADTIHNVTMVLIGTGEESALAGLPHHITFRKCIISGRATQVNGPKTGISISGGQYINIEDNWISDIRYEFYDSNAVFLGVAGKHKRIVNNYLSSGTEVILSGGTGTAFLNEVVEDVLIEGNFLNTEGYMHRKNGTGPPPDEDCFYETTNRQGAIYVDMTGSPTNCAGGNCYRCNASRQWVQDTSSPLFQNSLPKGRIEFKQCRNCRIVKNIIKNGIVGNDVGNPGSCAMIPSQVDHSAGLPWANGENIEFRDNICDTTWRFVIATSYGASLYTRQNKNIVVENNLGRNLTLFPAMSAHASDGESYASTWAVTDGCENCIFNKNTVRLAGSPISFSWGIQLETQLSGYTVPGYQFKNSIIPRYTHGTYIDGAGAGSGCASLSGFMPSLTPTPFNNYVLVGSGTNPLSGCSTNSAVESSVAFEADSSLTPGSKYSATCSLGGGCGYTNDDGTDLGADVKKIHCRTWGVESGTGECLSTLRVSSGSGHAALSWQSHESCTVELYTDAARTALHADTADGAKQADSRAGNLVSGQDRVFVLGTIAPLTSTPRTDYFGLLKCGNKTRPFEFKTRAPGAGRTVMFGYSSARTGQIAEADDPTFTDPAPIGSGAVHQFAMPADTVRWYRETGGKTQVVVEP